MTSETGRATQKSVHWSPPAAALGAGDSVAAVLLAALPLHGRAAVRRSAAAGRGLTAAVAAMEVLAAPFDAPPT